MDLNTQHRNACCPLAIRYFPAGKILWPRVNLTGVPLDMLLPDNFKSFRNRILRDSYGFQKNVEKNVNCKKATKMAALSHWWIKLVLNAENKLVGVQVLDRIFLDDTVKVLARFPNISSDKFAKNIRNVFPGNF